MRLIDDLLDTLPNGRICDVRIGLHWTAVVAEVDGIRRCGLASTLIDDHEHGVADVPQAGQLETFSALDIALFAQSDQSIMASVGVATINALLPPQPASWTDENAEETLARHGANRVVALVGHFPFIPRLRPRVGELFVLERNLHDGDMPEAAAPEILPQADVVAITGLALINHTLEDLLKLCPAHAFVLILGPSTPLSPILFEHGVHKLCGSVVTAVEPVLKAIQQGANFRQVHRAGVRLVTMGEQ
jgi:uncharacterized protein (DUF4213/DUF364 family)